MLREMDQYIAYSKQPIESIKANPQKVLIKNVKAKKPRTWNQLTASQPIAEVFHLGQKDQKKDWYNRGQDRTYNQD